MLDREGGSVHDLLSDGTELSTVDSLLIISNRSREDLLTDESLQSLSPPRIISLEEFLGSVEPFSEGDKFLLLDIESSDDLSEIVSTVHRASADISLIALIKPGSLRRMSQLKEMEIDVYLQSPIEVSTLRQAIDAVKKDRKFVDPSLSDSIVEIFLK